MVKLIQMSHSDFQDDLKEAIKSYAHEKVRAGT